MSDDLLTSYLSPLGEDAPCGTDLEYDADFMALERAAAPRAERAMGDSVKAAEEPEWDKVIALSNSLFERTRDLRVATYLSTAWLRTEGLAGLARGLDLVHGLLENFWEAVHPQLDAEDDNDPTARVNAVVPLGDPLAVLAYLRNTPFVASPRIGRFSLRDLRVAQGTLKVPGNENGEGLPSMTDIEACCLDCDEGQLTGSLEAAAQILDLGKAIDTLFTDRIGTLGPDLKPLLTDAYELKKFLESQVALRTPETAAPGEEGVAGDETGAAPAAGGVAVAAGRIQSPEDVRRRLDELCEYYARYEPASPLPILLRRAQRLVGLSFPELLQDLAPGGLSELRTISGTDEF
ncbi:type VI secretion system protein TssA [Dyella ginsengisoli]|uniref:type VI secretion system protein TssA n=1 Tax=Dyella ginsengisoli TaxID=363848 RepID=UPI00034DB844|nr:type VI secretion system protein TssA [Dyella ginsengisoli]